MHGGVATSQIPEVARQAVEGIGICRESHEALAVRKTNASDETVFAQYLEDEDAWHCRKTATAIVWQNGVAITKGGAPVTRRLRAGAGRFIWEDIPRESMKPIF